MAKDSYEKLLADIHKELKGIRKDVSAMKKREEPAKELREIDHEDDNQVFISTPKG